MREFFCLDSPESEQLIGKVVKSTQMRERASCPIDPDHQFLSDRARISYFNRELQVTVKHNKRDHMMIWAGVPEQCLVHTQLIREMESAGFTGFSCRPATVRFRDGFVTDDYCRLAVSGWGGLARPESGIHLVEACSGCLNKRWTPLADSSQLIDESQWTGEDVFIVWPLANYTFVTARVAELLRSSNVKSCTLRTLEPGGSFAGRDDFRTGSLAGSMPLELAQKFGSPLGIF
jgi:hypothetical protein